MPDTWMRLDAREKTRKSKAFGERAQSIKETIFRKEGRHKELFSTVIKETNLIYDPCVAALHTFLH